MGYHSPVLLKESVNGLNINPKGIYVDVTFGGGGHSKSILERLDGGKLFAFDQDSYAFANKFELTGFKLIYANFRYIKNFLKMEGVVKIDGLLADLGVSSHQLDVPERGFSIRFDAELDMRMDIKSGISAKDIIREYSEEELVRVFYDYGELRNSRRIASKIIESRQVSEINTTGDLINLISCLVPARSRNKFLARVFQAIRIEVNDEIGALKDLLLSAEELLNPEGRLVVLSYHSLEDRLVKNFLKKGNFQGVLQKDFFGNPIKRIKEINTKVIIASDIEVKRNPRARSAKLRIAEKLHEA